MDRKTYERTTENEFTGRKVKSLVTLKNGMFTIPAGTIFTITKKQAGFEVRSNPCPTCGISSFISRVQPRDIDFIDA